MKKLNILFIPEKLRWKISIRWFIAVIHLSVVPCTAVLTAEILNLFLSAVIAVSALPAATNMPWNALPVCPLNWLMSHIAIVFSQSIKVFVNSFSRIVLYSIVCFTLQTALSPVCFTKWINPKTSHPVLLWFYILLAEIWNGIHISTASYLKVVTAMMVFGVMSNTLITLFYAMLFARLCSMKWNPKSVLLSKKWRRNVIVNTNKVFMFMPNPTSAIPELL